MIIPALLRQNRDFRRFWLGQTISLLGDQLSMIAIPLVGVLVLQASAVQMGYLVAAGVAPNLLFALHVGAWVDRRGRRRRTMIVADVGRAALLVTIPMAYAAGSLTLAHLYVVAFLAGTLNVLFFVSYSTLFVSLVPRDRFIEASSLLNGSRAFSFVGGPSIGGLLVQIVSAPAVLVLDAVSYLASASFLGRIAAPEPPADRSEEGFIGAGAHFIRRSPLMRSALGASATINFFNFLFFALFMLYATRSLHVRPGTLGLVLGAAAGGGVLGAAVFGRIERRIGIGPSYMLGCLLFTAPLLLVPLARGPRIVILAALFLAEFGSGLGVMILDISIGSIFAAVIPDRLRARVSGAYMFVNFGVRPLGALAGGALGSSIGLRPALWIGAAGATAGILWLLPSPLPRLRSLPEPDQQI